MRADSFTIGKFRGNPLTLALRWLKARLFDGPERFFVETCAAAPRDFRFCDSALGINLNSQHYVAFQSGAQRHRG